MQQDLLQPNLTVLENMKIAADLKLGTTLSSQHKLNAIQEILRILRLQGATNTSTSRLSGGERKRLSIALELVDNPPVIFLDEPTTGLDDLSSLQCISLLKTLAVGGRTVICSIHTPSARLFSLFDHVYIVADGQCVFRGNGADIVPFLDTLNLPCPLHYNPADFIIEVSSGEYGDHIEKMVGAMENGVNYRWRLHPLEHEEMLQESENVKDCTPPLQGKSDQYDFDSSSWMQFRILVYRTLLQSWRDTNNLILRFFMYVVLGLILGGTFFQFGQDASLILFNFGFCFCCMIVYLYIPMMPVLLQYPSEVQLLKREYFNRWYSFNAYFFAATISRIPSMVVFSAMYFMISYTMTGQPLEFERMVAFFTLCIMIGLVSESFGLAVASCLNLTNAMFVGPSLTVPLMLLSTYGMGQRLEFIPLVIRMGMILSYMRYGLEGLVVSIYGNGRLPLDCPEDIILCEMRYPRELLRQMGMENASVGISFAGLIASFMMFRCASYVLLRWRLSSYRNIPALNYVGRIVKRHITFTNHYR
ncbi:ATP-binding cassette sub-family G member 4 isoform X2 [Anabrus simplex]